MMELQVTIIEARNLPHVSVLGESNPYCLISLNEVTFDTNENGNAVTPKWEYSCTLPITDLDVDTLKVNVMDNIKNNSIIGSTEVKLSDISQERTEEWYSLIAGEKLAGEIHLILVLSTSPRETEEHMRMIQCEQDINNDITQTTPTTTAITSQVMQDQNTLQHHENHPRNIQPERYENVQQIEEVLQQGKLLTLAAGGAPTANSKERPELHVRVKEGKDLYDAQTFGKQDPFCKITVGDKTFRTKVHDNGGRDPKWDESFVFGLADPLLDQLMIQIEDANYIINAAIGTCQLPVSIWTSGKQVEQWYSVNHGNKQRGEILLSVQLTDGSKSSHQVVDNLSVQVVDGSKVSHQVVDDLVGEMVPTSLVPRVKPSEELTCNSVISETVNLKDMFDQIDDVPFCLFNDGISWTTPANVIDPVFNFKMKIVAAINLYDSHLFQHRNLYCKLSLSDHTYHTRVVENCGKNPIWDDEFCIPLQSIKNPILVITIEDDNVMRRVVGTCSSSLTPWMQNREEERWLSVSHQGTNFGELCVVGQVVRVERELAVNIYCARNFGILESPICTTNIHGKLVYTTKPAKSNSSPIWNEAFMLKVIDTQADALDLEIFPSQTEPPLNSGGTCHIPIGGLMHKKVHKQWHPIRMCGEMRGEIYVVLEYRETMHPVTAEQHEPILELQTIPQSSPTKLVQEHLLQVKNKGMDVYSAFAKADTDRDGMLSSAEFRCALESFQCFNPSEMHQIQAALEKKNKTISLSELKWLHEMAIESEWKNMFFHPYERPLSPVKESETVAIPIKKIEKIKNAKQRESNKANKPPGGMWMSDDQLCKLIDALAPSTNSNRDTTSPKKSKTKVIPRPKTPALSRKPMEVHDVFHSIHLTSGKKPIEGPKTKVDFIREAIPLALKSMTELMQMTLQRGGDGDSIGIWLTQEELYQVATAFYATVSNNSSPTLDCMPMLDVCEEIVNNSSTCHLCLGVTANYWCCDCRSAICKNCLREVRCQERRHQLELFDPLGNVDIKEQSSILPEKQSKLTFIPLVVGSALETSLVGTQLQHADAKTLKEFCTLVRKQIEMQPLSKVTLGFLGLHHSLRFLFGLDRSCVSRWSPDELRCFLDVVQVPSAKFYERSVNGPQFLRLSVPSLHDMYGISASFQLHRCLFYRSLLQLIDQWVATNVVKEETLPTRAKQKHVDNKKKKLKQNKPAASSFYWDVPEMLADTPPLAIPVINSTNKRQSTKPPIKQFSPVKKLHSATDEQLVTTIQESLKQLSVDTMLQPSQDTIRKVDITQRKMNDLVQRFEIIRSITTQDRETLDRIDSAEKLVQSILVMAPRDLDTDKSVRSLASMIHDIETKLKKESKPTQEKRQPTKAVPAYVRESKQVKAWAFDMPTTDADVNRIKKRETPGPADYSIDRTRAFPTQKATRLELIRPVRDGSMNISKTMMSELGFNMPGLQLIKSTTLNDEQLTASPPPDFDIEEFLAEETTRVPTLQEDLFDDSFLETTRKKGIPQRSTWQQLRAKYQTTPTPLHYNTTFSTVNPTKRAKCKPKPPKNEATNSPSRNLLNEPTDLKQTVDLEWAKRIQASYVPLNSSGAHAQS